MSASAGAAYLSHYKLMDDVVSVRMEGIKKSFGGTVALNNMEITLRKGKIHALLGENGAGKSTLMKVLSGVVRPDAGRIFRDGREMHFNSPRDSIESGISVIYQEFVLAPDLTVAENIFIDRLNDRYGLVNDRKLKRDARKLLESLGFSDIDPDEKVEKLSVAYQQITEICKSLSRNARVLVLDEPSAVLTYSEIEKLFELLRKLRDQGIAIIYISHRLEEIFQLCDEITVMKDGCLVGHYSIEELNKEQLVEKMVGRKLSMLFPERHAEIGETILKVEHLNAGRMVQDISFELKRGEVIGFSGLVGSGRTETMRAIFGADPKQSGKVIYKNREVWFKSPHESVKNGFGLLPEDRKQQGVLIDMPIVINATLTVLKKVSRFSYILTGKENSLAVNALERLKTKYGKLTDDVNSLSGGNQQKVALAKWLASGSEIIVLDEPTRGVDVGAKAEIYKNINDLAESGLGIIIISSEMEEIINMCDRSYVMRQGRITGCLEKEDLNEISLMKLSVEV